LFAVELEKDLLAEAETLLPRVYLVAGLLCCVFIRSKIENQYGFGHACSITALGLGVKGDAISCR
jgi:hypothetical protein